MSSKLTFGPPGSQWIYDKQTKTYDLTRHQPSSDGSTSSLKISLTYGPPSTSLLLSPCRTALIVVDMQNFFLHPSCRSHPSGLAAVPPLVNVIARCREVGVQVVWLNWGLTDQDLAEMPAGVLRGFASRMLDDEKEKAGLGVDLGRGMGRTLCEGAWNSEIYEGLLDDTAAAAGEGKGAVDKEKDVFVAKNRMSGLWCESQPLWKYLKGEEGAKEGGKEKATLLFAGVNTDQCVLGTLTNAYSEYFSLSLLFQISNFCGLSFRFKWVFKTVWGAEDGG